MNVIPQYLDIPTSEPIQTSLVKNNAIPSWVDDEFAVNFEDEVEITGVFLWFY